MKGPAVKMENTTEITVEGSWLTALENPVEYSKERNTGFKSLPTAVSWFFGFLDYNLRLPFEGKVYIYPVAWMEKYFSSNFFVGPYP